MYDRTIGNGLHLLNTALFLYYLFWILVTPFIDADHLTQRFFPPREYGVAIPAIIVVTFFTVACIVASLVMIFGRSADDQSVQPLSPAEVPPFVQPPMKRSPWDAVPTTNSVVSSADGGAG